MLGSLSALFHSTAFVVVRDVAITCAVVFWLGCAYWTHRDAKRRIDDPLLVWPATLLGLVPILGVLAYLLFRPPETIEDVRARRIELSALELRLDRPDPACPVCRTAVEAAFLVCPVCTTKLKDACRACTAPLDPLWQACPYCATAVRGAADLDLDAALTAEAVENRTAEARTRRPRRAAAS